MCSRSEKDWIMKSLLPAGTESAVDANATVPEAAGAKGLM